MLFFRSKQKSRDILPPPHPDSDLELEELEPSLFQYSKTSPVTRSQLPERHKFFDEIIIPETETFPEEDEFRDLVKGIEKPKQKKVMGKKRSK